MNYSRFEEACKKKGTTPTALTLKLGLSKGNASSWKKGGNPSADILIKISDELETSIDYLLDRTDNPTVTPLKSVVINKNKRENKKMEKEIDAKLMKETLEKWFAVLKAINNCRPTHEYLYETAKDIGIHPKRLFNFECYKEKPTYEDFKKMEDYIIKKDPRVINIETSELFNKLKINLRECGMFSEYQEDKLNEILKILKEQSAIPKENLEEEKGKGEGEEERPIAK